MLLDIPVPSLIGGVSQQDPKLRLSNQVQEQVNAHSSPTRGLVKRPPTQHIGKVEDGTPGDLFFHTINRDPEERYFVVVRDGDLKVFSAATGEEYVVNNGGPAAGFPGPTFDPDFSYLTLADGTRPSNAFAALTVNDYTFIANRSVATAVEAATGPVDPDLTHAFLYVRQGAYKTSYNVNIQLAGGTLHAVTVNTWDGTTAEKGQEKWRLTWGPATNAQPDVGPIGTVWNVSVAGIGNKSVTIDASNRNFGYAIKALSDALGTLPGISTQPVYYSGLPTISLLPPVVGFIIRADFHNVSIDPTTTKNGGAPPAPYTQTELQAATADEESVIKTDQIAAILASKLSAVTDLTAVPLGSVVRLTSPKAVQVFDVTDSIGDTALVRINRQVENYTDLPQVCQDGYVVKVVGAPGQEDDFYVKFISEFPGTLGKGVWEEAVALGAQDGLDASTMPWLLIRRQVPEGSSVPGVPEGGIFFSWERADWSTRDVGDAESNPLPSFVTPIEDPASPTLPVPRYIDKLFFWQNRLGVVSGQQVILSETGRYFNFWRTTTTSLLDSDPVDIAASHDIPVYIKHLTPLNGRLILWAARAQLELTGEPLVTPQTAAIQPLTSFEFSMDSEPAALGNTILFARPRGGYAAFGEVFQQGDNNNLDDTDISGQIPRYVPAGVRYLAGSSIEDMVAVVTEGDPGSLFIYKFFWGGQEKLQSAWYQWTFQGGEVAYADFLDHELYLFIQRDDGLYLEKIEMGDQGVDEGLDRIIHLDRRIFVDPFLFSQSSGPTDFAEPYYTNYTQSLSGGSVVVTYDHDLDVTSYALPHPITDGAEVLVVRRADGMDLGAEVVNPQLLTVEGNTAFTPVFIGEVYTMRVRLTEPRMQEDTGRGRGYVGVGVLQVKRLNINYTATGYLRTEVRIPGRTEVYTSEVVDILPDIAGELDSVVLHSGATKVPVLSRNEGLLVDLVNDTYLPSNVVSAEWLAEFTSQSTRYRG